MSGSLIPNAKQQFLDANGNPLAGGFVYYYIPSTTTFKNTYQNAALTILNTNPIVLDSAGECIAYGAGSYRQIVTDVNGNLIWDQPTLSLLTNDATNVIYTPPFTNSVAETVSAKLSESVSVKDFGAKGDSTTNDTTAIQNAINYCLTSGNALYFPSGIYKTTSTLNIVSNITIYGDGNQESIIDFYSTSTTNFAIFINIPSNTSCIGLDIGNIGIKCNSGIAIGSGISITTNSVNSAISQSNIHDIYIKNVTIGVRLDGVIYMTQFNGITVSGGVSQYGWYAINSLSQLIYNNYSNLEVTNVGNNAYAYNMNVPASTLTNLTADGCCSISGFYTTVNGLFVEGITATTPASTTAIAFNAISSAQNIGIINVPNSKCNTGIDYIGNTTVYLNGVLFPDSGVGNQPNKPLVLHASNIGTISNIKMFSPVVSALDTYTAQSILNGFIITGCQSITSNATTNLTYEQGNWTPTFATGWTIAPTVVSAQYTKLGRQVTVNLVCQNGVSTTSAQISGLPFSCSSFGGSAAACAVQDSTIRMAAAIYASQSFLQSIPAITFTGNYWQLSITYFV